MYQYTADTAIVLLQLKTHIPLQAGTYLVPGTSWSGLEAVVTVKWFFAAQFYDFDLIF